MKTFFKIGTLIISLTLFFSCGSPQESVDLIVFNAIIKIYESNMRFGKTTKNIEDQVNMDKGEVGFLKETENIYLQIYSKKGLHLILLE